MASVRAGVGLLARATRAMPSRRWARHVGNTDRSGAPLTRVGGEWLRSPDFSAIKDGVTAFWEVKSRSRASVDPLTGESQHWIDRAAFSDYLKINVKTGTRVWVVLYEAPTATTPGRWLQTDVAAPAGGRHRRRAPRGERRVVAAWVWPVSEMQEIPGPVVDVAPGEEPILPGEGEGVPGRAGGPVPGRAHAAREKRGPAACHARPQQVEDRRSPPGPAPARVAGAGARARPRRPAPLPGRAPLPALLRPAGRARRGSTSTTSWASSSTASACSWCPTTSPQTTWCRLSGSRRTRTRGCSSGPSYADVDAARHLDRGRRWASTTCPATSAPRWWRPTTPEASTSRSTASCTRPPTPTSSSAPARGPARPRPCPSGSSTSSPRARAARPARGRSRRTCGPTRSR